jgi:gliding motility-associated-like protein
VVEFYLLVESSCPPVFIVQQETLCPGDSLLIQGEWITDAGQYSFSLTDPTNLCDTILDVYVTLWDEIAVGAEIDWNCITLGSISLDISGDGPFIIDWEIGATGDTLLEGLPAGNYGVVITDINGCSISDVYGVEATGDLSFSIEEFYEVEEGDSVLVTILGDVNEAGLTFTWYPEDIVSCPVCPQSWVNPTETTTLVIEITDADSCTYLVETVIIVNLKDGIYAPNVFSPNGDGINDHWTLVSKLETTFVNSLALFDRWGEVVFRQRDFLLNSFEGWNGLAENREAQPGVFIYVADVTLGDGRKARVTGDVTLVR